MTLWPKGPIYMISVLQFQTLLNPFDPLEILALNLDLDTAWVLRLGGLITQSPGKGLVGITSVVRLANVPVLQNGDILIRWRGDGIIKVAVNAHLALLVEHDLLLVIARLKHGHGDVGGWVHVEAHGLRHRLWYCRC